MWQCVRIYSRNQIWWFLTPFLNYHQWGTSASPMRLMWYPSATHVTTIGNYRSWNPHRNLTIYWTIVCCFLGQCVIPTMAMLPIWICWMHIPWLSHQHISLCLVSLTLNAQQTSNRFHPTIGIWLVFRIQIGRGDKLHVVVLCWWFPELEVWGVQHSLVDLWRQSDRSI